VNERTALECLLEARSVAVVGASPRAGSFGEQMLLELRRGRFPGDVFPVNPRYEEVLGLRCHPSLSAIGEEVDLVLLGVPNSRLEEQMAAAADAGARAAVIFASGFEAPRAGVPPLIDRVTEIATKAGMAVCGGNCMGFLNLQRNLRAGGFPTPEDLEPGSISFISHSGSAFAAVAHNDRSLRFDLVVSAGQEFVLTAADYMHYVLDRGTTRVLALFLETVRDPANFRSALAKAAAEEVSVVALKVGREGRAQELVKAHSGALAGADGAYEAVFDAFGVMRVQTLDEMADLVELFAAGRRAPPGRFASIHDSGGERALMIDVAAAEGVVFAEISAATKARLEESLEEGLPAVNPLDAWGTGNDAEDIFVDCSLALLDDPDVAALAFCVDLTTETDNTASYVGAAKKVFGSTHKPVAVLSNLASAVDRRDATELRAAGIPVLEGTETGLRAFGHLLAHHEFRALSPERSSPATTRPLPDDPFDALARHGIAVVATIGASDEDGALAAAGKIGYPVVLKTRAKVAHKSDVGGVVLGIRDREQLRAAYRAMAERLGPAVTVAATGPAGVEMSLGVVRDHQFGPLVMVGAGGVLIEILADRRFGLPPLDEPGARRMIDALRIRPLLDGARGRPPASIDSLVRALIAMSRLALEIGDRVDAIDVNPVIVSPTGCVAVDALIVPRSGSPT